MLVNLPVIQIVDGDGAVNEDVMVVGAGEVDDGGGSGTSFLAMVVDMISSSLSLEEETVAVDDNRGEPMGEMSVARETA